MFYRQHHLACGCYCARVLSPSTTIPGYRQLLAHDTPVSSLPQNYKWKYNLHFCQRQQSLISFPKVPQWFLWTEYKHLYWLWVSGSLPPQKMKMMEVLIVCSSGLITPLVGEERCLFPWEPFPYELLCIIFCIKHELCPLWHIKSEMTAFWS